MKQFKGRVVTPGEVTAEAVVTKNGFNTLASLQMALQFGDKAVKCGDQSNKDLYGKSLLGKSTMPSSNDWFHHRRSGTVLCLLHEEKPCLLTVCQSH